MGLFARETIGRTADLIGIALFVLLVAGGSIAAAVIWFQTESVPAWVLAVIVAALLVVAGLAFFAGRALPLEAGESASPVATDLAQVEAQLEGQLARS